MAEPQTLYAIVYCTDNHFDGHVATHNGKYRVYTNLNRAKAELKNQMKNMYSLNKLKLIEYISNREIDIKE